MMSTLPGSTSPSTRMRDQFVHRHNPDQTYDSICVTCILTVAKANQEQDLAASEQQHVCHGYQSIRISDPLSLE
jgi:hypothetical protein